IDTTLGELPRIRDVEALADENHAIGSSQNSRDIRLILHSTDRQMSRHSLLNIAIALVVLFIAGLWFCQPTRQGRRQYETLLEAVERKDWKELSELMAADYSDRWGHDKATIIERSKMV